MIKEGFMQKRSKLIYLSLLCVFILGSALASADIDPKYKDKDNRILRTPTGTFDQQKNTVSNFEFYTSNYGIFGFNIAQGVGGGYWPRGSANQYIFAGGIWFGAERMRRDTNLMKKYVELSYNPNNGRSWMVPGRIEDGDIVDETDNQKYRTYFSTDFLSYDGVDRYNPDFPNWPIWDSSTDPNDTLKKNRYFGRWVPEEERKREIHERGPAFISGEDIFCTYKDTDLSYYDGGATIRARDGYPLRLQFEQTIYSWGFGEYKDFIFIAFNIINKSADTLLNCWVAPVMDVDIARAPNTRAGAANDRVKYYDTEDTLNLALQWTDVNRGEAGYNFGYLGFDFLESPSVIETRDQNGNIIITDSSGFVRKDKPFYSNNEQLGLVSFRNWSIDDDLHEDEIRYGYISEPTREGDVNAGDKRFMMSTGPFNMRPGDTTRVVVGIILAPAAVKNEADGSDEDVAALVAKDKFAQEVYDNNFRAPTPPDRSVISEYDPETGEYNTPGWKGNNHSIQLSWDVTAERSIDPIEDGLDFMGYKLYRARRPNLDTFTVDNIFEDPVHPSGTGPFGWKQIGEWTLPSMIHKSYVNTGTEGKPLFIDSLEIIGPVTDELGGLDTFAIRVMRIPRGVVLFPHDSATELLKQSPQFPYPGISDEYVPMIASVDTGLYAQPWGPYFKKMYDRISDPVYKAFLHFDENKKVDLFDSVMVAELQINSSLMPYNPLLYEKKAIPIDPTFYHKLDKDKFNGIFFRKDTIETVDDQGNPVTVINDVQPVDSVYYMNSFRRSNLSSSQYIIDALYPKNYKLVMRDSVRVKEVRDMVYEMIKAGKAIVKFPQFESSDPAVNELIIPYMSRITNNRTFFDIGDDNRDGKVEYNTDIEISEKLVNNIPYYYKLLAFDEGDFVAKTEHKLNDAFPGLPNFAETYPRNARVGEKVKFEVTYVDTAKIGGLYNFEFYAVDPERVYQNFNGHELELEFNPYWSFNTITLGGTGDDAKTIDFGMYSSELKLTDLTTGDEIMLGRTFYEEQPCAIRFRGGLTENAASYVLSDTVIFDPYNGSEITFGLKYNQEKKVRAGKFSIGDFTQPGYCYSYLMQPPAYGTIGFSFDYHLAQYGGMFRPHSFEKGEGVGAVTPMFMMELPRTDQADVVMTTQMVDYQYYERGYNSVRGNIMYGSFNNGPARYMIEFHEGGDTTMNLRFGGVPENEKNNETATFNVKYLNMKIYNMTTFKRPNPDGGDSVDVTYPIEITHLFIDTIPERNWPLFTGAGPIFPEARYYPDPRNLTYHGQNANEFIGKYNIAAYGWIDVRQKLSVFNLWDHLARPRDGNLKHKKESYSGFQGKYYLSAKSTNGENQLDFCHTLNIGGSQFIFDYANMAQNSVINWAKKRIDLEDYVYGDDFKAGDVIYAENFGGVLGLPLPGAKVRVKIGTDETEVKPIDEDMDEIKVVPNPYYISHQGQKSPYDAKIYFTRLPKKCTIDIFTITGNHVQTIEHNEIDSPEQDKVAADVWNLITKNGLRAQSQTFIAYITEPGGAQTTQKFTIVVGGFRVIQE